jgi:hypothetical protein
MELASLLGRPDLFVRQRKEWVEILVDWETRNQYSILDAPLEALVVAPDGSPLLSLRRPFFWIFSHLSVESPEGPRLGEVARRFGVLYKRYDLRDGLEMRFARVASPRWRLWTFPVEGEQGQTATISKKWGGMLREVFSDADTFRVEFGTSPWTDGQRAVIFAAALSIDFDFFENNTNSGGVLDFGGD